MVVHPAKGNWSGTLVNALQWHFRDHLSTGNGHLRAGIVHRLDKDTSGVILIAKDDVTHRDLAMQFETRKVFKEYVAITAGELDRDTRLHRGRDLKMHPHDRLQMIVSTDPDAKHALQLLRGAGAVPRVHAREGPAADGPHAPDPRPPAARRLPGAGRQALRRPRPLKLSDLVPELPPDEDEVLIGRQALHAFRLRFRHPRTEQWIEAEAPLPADMRRALEALRDAPAATR